MHTMGWPTDNTQVNQLFMTVPETNEVAPPMGELESEKLTFDKLLFMKLDSLFLLLFISPFTYYTYRRFINSNKEL